MIATWQVCRYLSEVPRSGFSCRGNDIEVEWHMQQVAWQDATSSDGV